MADYTIKNLMRDVEDSAPGFGLGDVLEARFGRKPLGAKKIGMSFERLQPNARTPFGHEHHDQEEIYLVIEGSGRIKLDDEIRDVKQWDMVRVSGDTVRNWEAGPDGLAVVVAGGPITSENDSEIHQNWWSDES
jgi:mannose-6-phosphate isomerase-like protein (cupin superfamily)